MGAVIRYSAYRLLAKYCNKCGNIQRAGLLAPANSTGAVFAHADFQMIAEISIICSFFKRSDGIPSLMPILKYFGY